MRTKTVDLISERLLLMAVVALISEISFVKARNHFETHPCPHNEQFNHRKWKRRDKERERD